MYVSLADLALEPRIRNTDIKVCNVYINLKILMTCKPRLSYKCFELLQAFSLD